MAVPFYNFEKKHADQGRIRNPVKHLIWSLLQI